MPPRDAASATVTAPFCISRGKPLSACAIGWDTAIIRVNKAPEETTIALLRSGGLPPPAPTPTPPARRTTSAPAPVGLPRNPAPAPGAPVGPAATGQKPVGAGRTPRSDMGPFWWLLVPVAATATGTPAAITPLDGTPGLRVGGEEKTGAWAPGTVAAVLLTGTGLGSLHCMVSGQACVVIHAHDSGKKSPFLPSTQQIVVHTRYPRWYLVWSPVGPPVSKLDAGR